jgi:hypothetical protein
MRLVAGIGLAMSATGMKSRRGPFGVVLDRGSHAHRAEGARFGFSRKTRSVDVSIEPARADLKPFLGTSDNTDLDHWLWANGIASVTAGLPRSTSAPVPASTTATPGPCTPP